MKLEELIQVAGVIDQAEADLLIGAGVKFLGFPLRLPVNKEDLSEVEAGAIIRNLPPGVHGILITYLDQAEEIVAFCEELGAGAVQLHGDVRSNELERLKQLRPDLVVFKSLVIGVHAQSELQGIVQQSASWIDAFITDTFDPKTGASGATGKVHDWELSRQLVELSPKPVILAGGLNPENVCEAIEAVRPAGVDSHTGLEAGDGRKDLAMVERFVQESRKGFHSIQAS